MATDDWTTTQSTEDRPFLRTATELLRAGQYEHLAELLQQVQSAHDRKGDPIPAQVLVLACRICLACGQSQAEAAWHQQAGEEATRREDELRRQLGTLLDLAGEGELSPGPGEGGEILEAPRAVPGPPRPSLPEPEQPLSLWQRVLELLHLRLGPQPSEEDTQERLRPVARESEVPAPSPDLPQHEAGPFPPAQPETTKELSSPSLVVYCLGPFRVHQDDQPVDDWPSGKGKAIFKYLVTHRERPVVKEVLMELFWPGAHPDAARNNLNVAIYGLRQALRKGRPAFSHVLYHDDCYLLNPDLGIWVDIEEFVTRCRSAQQMEQRGDQVAAMREYHAAEVLYEGEFLEEDRYDDWVFPRRQRLQDDYLRLLDRLSRCYLDREDEIACTTVCRKMLAVDPCREEAHRRLMRCYSRQGQPYLALRQYHLCVETLKEEFDVPPTQETTALYEQVRHAQRA